MPYFAQKHACKPVFAEAIKRYREQKNRPVGCTKEIHPRRRRQESPAPLPCLTRPYEFFSISSSAHTQKKPRRVAEPMELCGGGVSGNIYKSNFDAVLL